MYVCLFTLVVFGFVCEGSEINYRSSEHDSDHKVVLKPPANLSTLLVSSTWMYIMWDPPIVYPIYDVDPNNTKWADDAAPSRGSLTETESSTSPPTTSSTTLSPNTENGTINGESITEEYTGTNSVSDSTTSGRSSPSESTTSSPPQTTTESKGGNSGGSATRTKRKCQPYAYLLNRTMPGDYLNFLSGSKTGSFVTSQHIKMDKPKSSNVTIGVNQVTVPFDEGCVEKYLVYVYNSQTDKLAQTKTLEADKTTEMRIDDLEASTTYRITVAAVFTSQHQLNSTGLLVTTKADPNDKVCKCFGGGTLGGALPCNFTKKIWCPCKPGYSGLFCEACEPGFYRTAAFFPCHACPCSRHSSKVTSCHFMEGFLVCDKCRTGYTGNLCHQCANGYYRYKNKYCVQCSCHSNTDPKSPLVCDPFSGACVSCSRNTTGFNCERCREGYIGDAVTYKNCTLRSDTVKEDLLPLPANYIAGICVGTILVLCVIVGCVVYKRWKMYPAMKPFWTVELKEDHEGVNFSAVDDQDFLKASQSHDDGSFYEKRGGKGMKYAQLREDV